MNYDLISQTAQTGATTYGTGDWSESEELRTMRMTCMVGFHDYRQGMPGPFDALLYCSKCGDVIPFEIDKGEIVP